jgi:hypothetical protein
MANVTYTIKKGKMCGNPKTTLYHIFVEGEGITHWNLPCLKQAKLNRYCERYEIWTKEPEEQVLNDFIALYGEEFEKLTG